MNKWLTMGVTPGHVAQATAPKWEKEASKEEKRKELYLAFLLQLSLYKEPFFSPGDLVSYMGIAKETIRRKIWEINNLAGVDIIELSHATTAGYRTGTIRYYKLIKDWRAVFNSTIAKQVTLKEQENDYDADEI